MNRKIDDAMMSLQALKLFQKRHWKDDCARHVPNIQIRLKSKKKKKQENILR